MGSGTTRRCGLIGAGVTLLEEVCYPTFSLYFNFMHLDISPAHISMYHMCAWPGAHRDQKWASGSPEVEFQSRGVLFVYWELSADPQA